TSSTSQRSPRSAAPSRRSQLVGKQDPPDRARGHAHAELEQLAGDPRIAPARILPREAQDQLADAIIDGRPAAASTRVRPPAAHELPVPAQKCLRRHDQTASARLRQEWRQRGQEGATGWPQRGASLLPSEHNQLMAQDEQLDVFGELSAPVPDQQPEHSREGEIGERKQHPAILPSTSTERAAIPEE